jgi:hypothetical protein
MNAPHFPFCFTLNFLRHFYTEPLPLLPRAAPFPLNLERNDDFLASLLFVCIVY